MNNAIEKLLQNELDPAFKRRARLILSNLVLKRDMKVLDVGCGRGFYANTLIGLNSSVRVVAIDANAAYIEKAKRTSTNPHITFLKADARKLPFKNNSFDAVICSEVLEHIPQDEKVLGEIHRVLRKGGCALISVPARNYPFFWDPLNFILEHTSGVHVPKDIWWLAGIWADHVRLYSQQELEGKATKAKFHIENIWRITSYCLPFIHFLLYGIGKNLVEKGMVSSEFDRFSSKKQESFLLKCIKFPIYAVDRFNRDDLSKERFLNFVVKIKK